MDFLTLMEGTARQIHVYDFGRNLYYACSRDDPARVARLLDAGANKEWRSGGGQTPIIYATMNGFLAIVKLLADRGADIHVRDKQGLNALMWAARKGKTAVAEFLLDRGVDIHVRDKNGGDVLQYAISAGHIDTSIMLIEKQIDAKVHFQRASFNHFGLMAIPRIKEMEKLKGIGRLTAVWFAKRWKRRFAILFLDKTARIVEAEPVSKAQHQHLHHLSTKFGHVQEFATVVTNLNKQKTIFKRYDRLVVVYEVGTNRRWATTLLYMLYNDPRFLTEEQKARVPDALESHFAQYGTRGTSLASIGLHFSYRKICTHSPLVMAAAHRAFFEKQRFPRFLGMREETFAFIFTPQEEPRHQAEFQMEVDDDDDDDDDDGEEAREAIEAAVELLCFAPAWLARDVAESRGLVLGIDQMYTVRPLVSSHFQFLLAGGGLLVQEQLKALHGGTGSSS